MGDKFLAMLDFATRHIGKLKKCTFYGSDFSDVEVTTPDGKTLKITMHIEEEETNA